MKKNILNFFINLIIMGVVLVLVVFFVFKGIDKFTRHGEVVVVPDIKGLSISEAKGVLIQHGLSCVVSDSTYVKGEIPGIVLDYTPSTNKVKEGRIIYLKINNFNVPLRPVPDVADNSSARQARATIEAAGFKLTDDEYISGQKDWVYEVKYNGKLLSTGSSAPVGALLTLVVGHGGSSLETDSLAIETQEPLQENAQTEFEESWFD